MTPSPFDGLIADPNVLPLDEERLSGQNLCVFRLLRQGPRTNVKLARATGSMAIHSRISDVRQELQKDGWDIKQVARDGGIITYAIIEPDGNIYRLGLKPEDYRPGVEYRKSGRRQTTEPSKQLALF